MSMSQFPSPDEEYDEIYSHIRWYHLPLLLLSMFVLVPVFSFLSGIRWKGKK